MFRSYHEYPPSPVVDGCVEAYRAAFAEPPYGEPPDQAEQLRDRLSRYAGRDGYCVAVADDDHRGILGFGLAVTAQPGDWWREQVAAALGPELTERWLGDACTEIVHLAVVPTARRAGLGSGLLDVLMTETSCETATLSCHPHAPAAQRLYLSRGWTVLRTDFVTQPGQLGFWLMGKALNAHQPRLR